MKDYTIWLKSGQAIVGKVESGEWIDRSIGRRGIITICDTDGYIRIKAKNIVAVAICDQEKETQIKGF